MEAFRDFLQSSVSQIISLECLETETKARNYDPLGPLRLEIYLWDQSWIKCKHRPVLMENTHSRILW